MLAHRIAQGLARLEGRHHRGGDLDALARPRVPPSTRWPAPYRERAEPGEGDSSQGRSGSPRTPRPHRPPPRPSTGRHGSPPRTPCRTCSTLHPPQPESILSAYRRYTPPGPPRAPCFARPPHATCPPRRVVSARRSAVFFGRRRLAIRHPVLPAPAAGPRKGPRLLRSPAGRVEFA